MRCEGLELQGSLCKNYLNQKRAADCFCTDAGKCIVFSQMKQRRYANCNHFRNAVKNFHGDLQLLEKAVKMKLQFLNQILRQGRRNGIFLKPLAESATAVIKDT